LQKEGERRKADDLDDQRKQIWSQVRRENIAWGRLIRGTVVFIILVLIIVYRDSIASLIANTLSKTSRLVQDQSQAAVVANYLLIVLILATIGVEMIPFFVRWANRPRLSLRSISHFGNGELRVRSGSTPERIVKVRTVYLEIWNDGRSPAFDPVVEATLTDQKIPRLVPAQTDAVTLDKEIVALSSNVYDSTDLDDLAIAFIEKGMRKVQYIAGRQEGKRFVLGFAFEGGNHFYLASVSSALLPKIDFAQDKKQYLSVNCHARNASKKILRMNIPADLSSWDKVKFHYRAQEPSSATSNASPATIP
jgi:hypothetical protein